MNRVAQIKHHLIQLEPTYLEVQDDSTDHIGHANEGAGHFTVIIASPRFAGLSRIQCHRLVYEALAPMMPSDIHALSIRIQPA